MLEVMKSRVNLHKHTGRVIMEGCSGSYAMSSVPGASLAILGPVGGDSVVRGAFY